MANPFIHIELQTNDIAKSKKFYENLFDWKLETDPKMDYTVIKVGKGTGGGMMKNPVPGMPDIWFPYIQVDNAVASTKKAKELGGKILRDVGEIPNVGWFSVIQDTTGAAFGLFQVKEGMQEPD